MAKQAVGPLERHIEKGVLGLAVLLLLGSVGLYLVRSPNTAVVGGQETAPGEINDRVRDAARSLRTRLANARPEPTGVEDPLPELAKGADPLAMADLDVTWPSPVPTMPRVPNIGNIVIEGELSLASAVAPGKPLCKTGRSVAVLFPTQTIEDPDAEDFTDEDEYYEEEVNWVTVAAIFDRRQQEEVCKLAGYKAGRRRAYLVGTEIQRRQQRLDGSWPEEWDDVYAYAKELPPAPPIVELVDLNGQLVPNPQSRSLVQQYYELVKDYQLDIIRPYFPDVVQGDQWAYPEFPDIELAALDRDYGWYEDGDEEDRVELEEDESKKDKEPKSARELEQETLAKIEQLFEQGRMTAGKDREKLYEALSEAQSLEASGSTASVKRKAEQWVKDIEQEVRDLDRWERRNRPDDEDEEEDDEETQPISPVQLVWLHDARPGSVTSGATYQYRMRLLLYNRYAATPGELKDHQDALTVFVVGPWSEPSDPVAVPHDTRFFLTSGGGGKSGVRVDIFKWFEGLWVANKFTVEVGEQIGGVQRTRIEQDDEIDHPKVDYSTGAIVVDIDANREVRKVGKKKRDGSFAVGPLENTVALVYMDAKGNLFERLLTVDKNTPDLKEMKAKLIKKKRVVKKKPPPPKGGPGRGGGGGGPGRGGGGRGGRGGRGGGGAGGPGRGGG